MSSTQKIIQEAIKLVTENPPGVRYSVLHRTISQKYPDIPTNTIHGALHKFRSNLPAEILLPSKGLYQHTKFADPLGLPPEPRPVKSIPRIVEDKFYAQFARWIVDELEECTRAIPLGGSVFKDKWGTPDVIGIREPRKSDIIKPPTEVIAAEIKTDSQQLIVAFGQACAYKLFSHRSYIVVPNDSSIEDVSRLDALARIFGIGLILFNKKDIRPEFEIRVRAARHEPDMFYVNKYLKLIEDDLFA